MTGKIIIRKSGAQFYYNLFAGNGERILQSEMYTSKQAARTGAEAVKANAAHDQRYERRSSTANQSYFVPRAGNNEMIGTSEMYSSVQFHETGISSCKLNGPTAEIVDQG